MCTINTNYFIASHSRGPYVILCAYTNACVFNLPAPLLCASAHAHAKLAESKFNCLKLINDSALYILRTCGRLCVCVV